MRRECELKYKIKSENELLLIKEKLSSLNFKFIDECIETDYTVDTEDGKCKKNNLILRFREVNKENASKLIMTLKIKGKNTKIQDNIEIESELKSINEKNLSEFNVYLKKYIGYEMPIYIKKLCSIKEVVIFMRNEGFKKCRMLSQKIRIKYKKDNIIISFDKFPNGVGQFLELETLTPSELFKIAKEIGLKNVELEKNNYGKIIIEKSKSRVCVFNKDLTNLIEKNY